MSARSKMGGVRKPTPDVDEEHLQDVLVEHVRTLGVEAAFDFGEYNTIHVAKAIKGPALAGLKDLVLRLARASGVGRRGRW